MLNRRLTAVFKVILVDFIIYIYIYILFIFIIYTYICFFDVSIVIIAGAGGAAHLPGMVAALTPLPVIGVPVKSSILNGEDSLLSIVQMPKGIPVATVAIGNAANAGLLAVRILGAGEN
jgi:NCAIR mutase (PurE)-related protein